MNRDELYMTIDDLRSDIAKLEHMYAARGTQISKLRTVANMAIMLCAVIKTNHAAVLDIMPAVNFLEETARRVTDETL